MRKAKRILSIFLVATLLMSIFAISTFSSKAASINNDSSTGGTPIEDLKGEIHSDSNGCYFLLRWDKVKGAVNYRIACEYGNKIFFATTKNNYYKATNPQPNVTYTYKVNALDKVGLPTDNVFLGNSLSITVPFNKPKLTGQIVKGTSPLIRITWNDNPVINKYEVWCDYGKGFKRLATTSSTSYTGKKPAVNTNYRYYVKGFYRYNKAYSINSDVVIKRVTRSDFLSQDAPKITNLTRLSNGIRIKWESKKNATSYNLYCRTNSSNSFRLLAIISGTVSNGVNTFSRECEYYDTDLTNGKTYEYCLETIADGKSYGKSEPKSLKWTSSKNYNRQDFVKHCKKHLGKTIYSSGVGAYWNIYNDWCALYAGCALNYYLGNTPAAQMIGFSPGVGVWADNAAAKGLFHSVSSVYKPRIGDLIVFGKTDYRTHIGVVTGISTSKDNKINNIEYISGNATLDNWDKSTVEIGNESSFATKSAYGIVGYIDTSCFLK